MVRGYVFYCLGLSPLILGATPWPCPVCRPGKASGQKETPNISTIWTTTLILIYLVIKYTIKFNCVTISQVKLNLGRIDKI